MSVELQNLDQLEAAMAAAGLDPAVDRGFLERTRLHLHRYAELETSLIGKIEFPVSPHILNGHEEGASWREIADLERKRLGIDRHQNANLMEALDRDGLKVYRPLFPPAIPWSGIFLFDRDVGPCLIADSALCVEDANGVFAQLLGHYLLDHDPFRISPVSRGSGGPHTPSLVERFASALLVGEADLDAFLDALNWAPGDPVDDTMLLQLSSFFETSPRIIGARLVGLDRIGVENLPPGHDRDAGPRDRSTPGLPSERFLRLALEAHAREMLDLATLAEYLEIEPGQAQKLAGRFSLEDTTDEGNENDKDS